MAEALTSFLRRMRVAGRVDEARRLLEDQLRRQHDERLAALAWQHAPFWWEPLRGPGLVVRRRGPDDAELVRRCWGDSRFMDRFNRAAAPLPADEPALRSILAREQSAILDDTRALHWTIVRGTRPVGFVSVADVSIVHRRAEYLIGLAPGAHGWAAPAASLLMFDFLSRRVGLRRLTAYFYPGNDAALRAACKLGFVVEGRLAGYLGRPDGGRDDLTVAGLQLDDAGLAGTRRLRRRLLAA